MIANVAIWIPGILFVYSAIFEERGLAMNIIVSIIQLLISSIGIYNIAISFLPGSFYSSIPDVRQIQISVFGLVILATQIFINFKEVAEHFLTVSIINFIPDIVLWKIIMVMYTEHRMGNFKIINNVYFLILMSYSIYKLRNIVLNIYKEQRNVSQSSQNDTKRPGSRKKREKVKNQVSALGDSNKPKSCQEKKIGKVKSLTEEVFPIVCQWRCINILNIGYISINCSEKCYNPYHTQCWNYYKILKNIKTEESLLSMSCLTAACCGKIYEIVWVDKYGIETPRKYISTELEKFRVGNRKRVKTRKPQKFIRNLWKLH